MATEEHQVDKNALIRLFTKDMTNHLGILGRTMAKAHDLLVEWMATL